MLAQGGYESVFDVLRGVLADKPHEYLRLPRLRVLVLSRKATLLYVSNEELRQEIIEAGSISALLNESAGVQAHELLLNTHFRP